MSKPSVHFLQFVDLALDQHRIALIDIGGRALKLDKITIGGASHQPKSVWDNSAHFNLMVVFLLLFQHGSSNLRICIQGYLNLIAYYQ